MGIRIGAGLLLLAIGLQACGDDEGTLIVFLRTDYDSTEILSFEATLTGGAVREESIRPSGDLLAGVQVARWTVPPGAYSLRGRMVGLDSEPLQQRQILVQVGERTGVTIQMTRSCETTVCNSPGATECLGAPLRGRRVQPRDAGSLRSRAAMHDRLGLSPNVQLWLSPMCRFGLFRDS